MSVSAPTELPFPVVVLSVVSQLKTLPPRILGPATVLNTSDSLVSLTGLRRLSPTVAGCCRRCLRQPSAAPSAPPSHRVDDTVASSNVTAPAGYSTRLS